MLYQSHLCSGSKWSLNAREGLNSLDVIYKTEALRLATTFDVSYRMKIGGAKIIEYLSQARKDDNSILVSKFIDALKEN